MDIDVPLDYSQAPVSVMVVPRFLDDLKALKTLLSDSTPPMRIVRSKRLTSMTISFVDASGKGAGASTLEIDKKISTLQSIKADREKTSSNFKELHNLVDTLEKEYENRNFHNTKVFLCTDNSVAERAFIKGSSKSPLLFLLVLRLHKLQLKTNFKLHVLHVAGSRMVEQGTDGLSRGIIYEGLLGSRYNFLRYLPLDKSSIMRSPLVLKWLQSLLPAHAEVLEPCDWFEKGHDIQEWDKGADNLRRPKVKSSCWIRDPPPAAAYKAAEQIRIAHHKREIQYIHLSVLG